MDLSSSLSIIWSNDLEQSLSRLRLQKLKNGYFRVFRARLVRKKPVPLSLLGPIEDRAADSPVKNDISLLLFVGVLALLPDKSVQHHHVLQRLADYVLVVVFVFSWEQVLLELLIGVVLVQEEAV